MGVDYGIDIDEVRRVIDAADVLVVRFALIDQRLLLDARTNDECGPLIRVVPKAGSARERFRSLKVLRPQFRTPDRILTFEWPRHVRALEESGLWDHIVCRLTSCGWTETADQCDEALRALLREERRVEANAVAGGEGFQTIWPSGVSA